MRNWITSNSSAAAHIINELGIPNKVTDIVELQAFDHVSGLQALKIGTSVGTIYIIVIAIPGLTVFIARVYVCAVFIATSKLLFVAIIF